MKLDRMSKILCLLSASLMLTLVAEPTRRISVRFSTGLPTTSL